MGFAYKGDFVEIPVGMDGLRTDDPGSRLSPGSLIRALNINIQSGCIEKDFGSLQWSSTALGTGIVAGYDWWPEELIQRLIAVGANGKVYRYTNFYTSAEVAGSGGAPATLTTSAGAHFVAGGAEETGNDRKLFIFTGYNPIQVIDGDGSTRRDITNPIPSWTGTNQPIAGVIHKGKVFTWLREGHTMFASSALDHEDFLTTPLPYEVNPGESERIACAFVFRTKLFVMKYPRGLYVLQDSDPDDTNWYFARVNGAIGAPGPRAAVGALDDMICGNEYGSITSLTATDQVGDVKSADIFAQLRCQQFVREVVNPDGRENARQAIYYTDRKIAMFTYRSRTSSVNDMIAYLDFSGAAPRVVWNDKDQPSALFLRKDINGIERPFYGAADGHFYEMDRQDRWVGLDVATGDAYTGEFWTPHFDFGGGDPILANCEKEWDMLQVKYLPSGDWDLTVDVYIDGRFHKKLKFNMGGNSDLDEFHLDTDSLESEAERIQKLDVGGKGRRISFRCYNEGLGENFRILSLGVFYRRGGQDEQKKKG